MIEQIEQTKIFTKCQRNRSKMSIYSKQNVEIMKKNEKISILHIYRLFFSFFLYYNFLRTTYVYMYIFVHMFLISFSLLFSFFNTHPLHPFLSHSRFINKYIRIPMSEKKFFMIFFKKTGDLFFNAAYRPTHALYLSDSLILVL